MNPPAFIRNAVATVLEWPGVQTLVEWNAIIERKMWSAKKRQAFYKRLAMYNENGKGLRESVIELHRQALSMSGPHWMRRFDINLTALAEISDRLAADPLADALEGWAPLSERGLIRSGEASGNVAATLRLAAGHQGMVSRIVWKIVMASIEPLTMLAGVVYLILVIGKDLVGPFLTQVPAGKWPPMAKLLIPMAAIANSPLTVWVIMALIGLAVASFATMPVFTGPVRKFLDRFPPWSIYKAMEAAKWMSGFSGMVKAGTGFAKTLRQQEQWSTPWLRERLEGARDRVEGGMELGPALYEAGHDFPDRVLIADITAFAGSDNFPETLRGIGESWLEDYETKLLGVLAMSGVAAIVLVSMVMIVVTMGMMSLESVMTTSIH
ncbi:MAG: type II secretion system F family protein [Betaproteobacteria bacterium]|nr:type II secretion system F family protein [Betaproteobacteria bacterium]